jgi:uncharacterized protein
MNEMAVVSGVKSLSDADRAKHMRGIDEHRKTIDRAQRGIREHLKAMFDGLDDDDSDTDDLSLLEEKLELQKLAEQAGELSRR